jgi:hypothetical protein
MERAGKKLEPISYYNPEALLFPALAQRFAETGQLEPEELYLILDWKAPRARTRHLKRLAKRSGSFEVATRVIAACLHTVKEPQERLRLLLQDWKFYLPTATAIVAVLYPDTYTIYDVRVCDALGGFHKLNRTWSQELWVGYQEFIEAVRAEALKAGAPAGTSLRDCDRWLWGKHKQEQMCREIGR